MKPKFYPAITAALSLALLVLLLDRLLGFWVSQPAPESPTPPLPTIAPIPPAPAPPPIAATPTPSSPSPTPVPAAAPVTAARAGALRVSNQSQHPLRVALLQSTADASFANSEPVHWDFAPAEGSGSGLILSLPDRDLKIQEGDLLVAFAQDGSRRYWGPYVVGKTAEPAWSESDLEWQLFLQP